MKIKNINLLILGSVFFLLFLLVSDKPVYAENRMVEDNMVFNIQNRATGKYLNVNAGTNANGTNVTQYTNDGSMEQKFRISRDTSLDAYRIYAMCSDKGSNRVLDVLRTGGSASGSIVSGNNVDIWTRGDDPCQLFDFTTITSTNAIYFKITLKSNPNLALTAYGTGNGSGAGTSATSNGNVYISTYTGATNQQWKLNAINVPPARPYKNYRGTTGTYYVDSNCGYLTSSIQNAASSWSPTISLTQASNNSSSSVDFYGVPDSTYRIDPSMIWLGHTDRFIGSTFISGEESNWAYSFINLNYDKLQSNEYATGRAKIVAHEIGHGYGLLHYNVSGTIMNSDYDGITVNTPSSIDRYAINLKY